MTFVSDRIGCRLDAPEPQTPFPTDQRVPFDASARFLTTRGPLRVMPHHAPYGPTLLRLVTGSDSRSRTLISVHEGDAGPPVATIPIDHTPALQPLDVGLPSPKNSGFWTLRACDTCDARPLAFLADAGLGPFLRRPGSAADHGLHPWRTLVAGVRSTRAVQPFGWMLGSVLDGLMDLGERSPPTRWSDDSSRRPGGSRKTLAVARVTTGGMA